MGLFEAILKKEQFYSHPFRTPVTKVAGQFWPLKGQVGQKSKKATKYVHVGCKTFQMSHCPLPYLPYRASNSVAYYLYYMIHFLHYVRLRKILGFPNTNLYNTYQNAFLAFIVDTI